MIALPASAQHVHVQISRPAGEWRLFIYDFDYGDYDPAEVPLFAGHQAFGFVPANTFTNFLGPADGGVWTLPEVEADELQYLGIGTSGIPPGTFANNQICLELRSLSGPGHFALYNIDPFGTPIVHMNSRDGINAAADSLALASSGGHVHVNWAFSAPGTYRVGLGASGVPAVGGQTNASASVNYTFIVQDIPWRPRLSALRGPDGTNVQVVVQTKSGCHCRIECTTNFTSWQALTNFITAIPTTTVLLPADFKNCGCRAVVLPP